MDADTHSVVVFPAGISTDARTEILQAVINQQKTLIASLRHQNAQQEQMIADLSRRVAGLESFQAVVVPLIEKLKLGLILLSGGAVFGVPLVLLWLQKMLHL